MKIKLLWIMLSFVLATLNHADAAALLTPQAQQSQAAYLSAKVLSRYHYKHVDLDDKLSAQIFDNYLKSLDGEKIFFLQSDIDSAGHARTTLDDAILDEDLHIPFAIFNLYQQRIAERYEYARSLLKTGFDFDIKESYQITRKDVPWAKSLDELNDVWRKRVKNDWLRLKLAGKDKQGIVETLDKRYEKILSSQSKITSEDVFQSFMNAYATALDPHTNYFGVRSAEEFDISMRLSLVGIGAVLNTRDEYTTIRELIPGGPAMLSGKLNPGDRIVGVGQGEDGPIVDVMGWRIGDTVSLIRGQLDSVVMLDVLPAEAGAEGKHKLIALIRKKINLDKQAAKKSIIDLKEGKLTHRIGVISLPGFYQDFVAQKRGDKDFRSATRDVSRLLDELKQDRVDGVLIDLRNNGGGSLAEAIDLTGLFIDQGPVVQQRDSEGSVTVQSDENAGVAWNGPLGVLINRGSASASEIFAAAIQDYGRGVVIGETSFGKGTVQAVANLDEIARNDKSKFGEIKMTVAQFFRINGGTTQLRGVTPDVNLPITTNTDDFGESSFDNALPWMQIKSADYKRTENLKDIVTTLVSKHDKRVAGDKEFRYLREDIAEFSELRQKNLISLNEAERRKERETQEARDKARRSDKVDAASGDKSTKARNHVFEDDGMLPGERNLKADLDRENAARDLPDILLNEAAHVVSDEASLLNASAPRIAATVSP
ncbi:MAG: carboxy terminal-processing peptidase [Gallionella sp.]